MVFLQAMMQMTMALLMPGVADLGRDTGGGFMPIAENIQAVEFSYILESGTRVSNPNISELNLIRTVQISVLARASHPDQDPNYTDTRLYTTVSGTNWGPFNDKYKRRFASITIQCRNLGM